MSAWTLTKTEIDVLVYWLNKTGVSNQESTSLGRLLWSENYKSIRARYGDWDWREGKYVKRPAYHYSRPASTIKKRDGEFVTDDPSQAAKMCHFYSYQTCEHSGWETSRAKRLIDKLENHLVSRYGADWQKPGLYWGL